MRKFAIRAERKRAARLSHEISERGERHEPLPEMTRDEKDRMHRDIGADIEAGMPSEQAVAIAYRRAREGYYARGYR